ncbi:neurogenic locus notch protein 1, partial [Plakobranchus ocellatus]
MLCQCDKGRGGIFCDEVTTADETMTTCEKERRLMLYVHEQVKGQKPRSPQFATFISDCNDNNQSELSLSNLSKQTQARTLGSFIVQIQSDETMTTCEKERRLMLYVHEQVKGQKPRSPRFATFISVILDRMKTPYYPVPFCWPEDPGSPLSREYHSMCYYDSGTGAQVFCQCVHTDKTPNNLIHYAEGDCREQTGQSHTSIDTFYVYASTNDTSSIESGVREQVARLIRPLFGRVDYVRVDSVIDGCVVVAVAWTVQTKVDWPLVDKLMESGIDVKGENFEVSSEMCKAEVDLDACPLFMVSEISADVPCPSICSMDSDCDEDSKCCRGSCGDKTCTEVGFLDKISVDITVDMAWDPQLSSTSSITYIVTKSAIESGLNQEFMRRAVPGFKSSKVLAFYEVEKEMEPVERKRRQVEAHLGITIEMKFTEELPVESLLQIQSDLLENGLQVMTNTYFLREVKFAGMGQGSTDEDSRCGFYVCSTRSLCGEKVGGIKYCACPKGWSGPSCDMMDCMSKGKSLCENGGSCVSYESGVNQCVCQVGYFGALCQERLCDHLNEDACGAGKCLGNLTSLDFCKCPVDTGGLFCELQTADPRMTMCQKVKRFMDFFVPVWQGLEKDDKIKSVDKFADILSHGGQLAVPKCWSDDSAQGGDYHSRCLYDMNTKKIDRCICTDNMGQPNYWEYDYESGQCRVYSQDCEGVICHNGGSCVGMPGGRSYCNCPDGFYGLGCENGAEDKCPEGRKPLMTDEGELQCRMFPCPFGFMCNGHPADKWTACCFDEEFLCKENLCQAGGTCHGDILSGDLCECPPDRGGLLCEKSMPDEDLTHCQKHQRFLDMIISILKGGTSPVVNLTVENLRRILIHNEMEWIPENSCDDQGMYKTMTQAVNVLNPAGKTKELCIGLSGIPDPTCGSATCEMLSTNGMPELCMNGGRCLGDVRNMLCDCTGTGYHGFLCQIPGVAPKNETACTLGRDIANYALEVLFDPEQPDEVKDQLNKIISFHGSEDAGIFVPTCDAMGRFEYSGCEHPRALGKMVTCYCATMNGEMFGEEIRLMQPPDNCDGMKPDDGDKDECPEEWGKECIKPAWWCSKMFQCKKHERCSQVASLSGEKFECVPKETVLPCDFRPCKDNPYAMCSICGLHGVCYNMMMGQKNYNMDKP